MKDFGIASKLTKKNPIFVILTKNRIYHKNRKNENIF